MPMNRFLLVLPFLFVATAPRVRATPMSSGPPQMSYLFRYADVVCTCRLVASEPEPGQPAPAPQIILKMRGTLEVEDAFKPAELRVGDKLTVRFERSFHPGSFSGSPLSMEPGQTSIVFLKATPDGSYRWFDHQHGVMGYFGPTGLPKASTGSGMSKLESALLSLLDIADRTPATVHYAIFALGKLEGFPILSPETLARLAEYVPSARPVPAFAAIRLILRTKSPQGAELLKQYLDDHEGESLQDGGMAWVSQVRDPCALPTLEALTRSKYRQVRAGA